MGSRYVERFPRNNFHARTAFIVAVTITRRNHPLLRIPLMFPVFSCHFPTLKKNHLNPSGSITPAEMTAFDGRIQSIPLFAMGFDFAGIGRRFPFLP